MGAANIPRFACPDCEVVEICYFRWWSFRKHLKQTTNGFVFTEFLTPVKHAGEHNTISCAVGLHLAEGRWLRDPHYVDDYTRYWLRGHDGKPQPHFHKYSSWFAAAVWDRYLVNGDRAFVTNLLDDLATDYRAWERERRRPDGLFWQYDVADGMEESISGSRKARQPRPTLNSYMFANARAIAALGRLAGRAALTDEFEAKAAELKRLTQEKLWNAADAFFEVRRETGDAFSHVREAIGFIPWMFGLPEANRGFEVAWGQITDPRGFRAPYGLTTAERRHPEFRSHGCCTCEWDGAVWPYATSQTLAALANVLRDYSSAPSRITHHVSRTDQGAKLWSDYRRYIASLPSPKIVVVQDLDKPKTVGVFWGEVNANNHRVLGCVGTIIDGAIRDLDEMTNAGFKALARRLCVGHAHSIPVRWNCEVKVFGRKIKPGQLIHADKHGVLAIPFGEEKHLLEAAAFMDANECNTMIATARNTAGRSTEDILAAMDAAVREFVKNVQAKFSRKGEWG